MKARQRLKELMLKFEESDLQKALNHLHGLGKSEGENLEKAPLIFEGDEENPYKTVWRIQNERGEGPIHSRKDSGIRTVDTKWKQKSPTFSSDKGFDEQDLKHFYSVKPEKVPRSKKGLADAFGWGPNPKLRFGVEKPEHIHGYFSPKEMDHLSRQGYKLTPVKAKKIWASKHQVFFEPYKEPVKKSASDRLQELMTAFDEEGLGKGARGDWEKEGYEIHYKKTQPGKSFIEEHGVNPVVLQGDHHVIVTHQGKAVGWASFTSYKNHIQPVNVEVKKEHRRKGLATAMYRHAEQSVGKKIEPSFLQSKEAESLWSQPNRPFGK